MPRLGPFALEQRLGRGSTANVWQALHEPTGELVALKVLRAEGLDRDWAGLFRVEARAVAALNHRNVVSLHDYGEVTPDEATRSRGALAAGAPWIAMELAAGTARELKADPADWSAVEGVARDVLAGLAFAHSRGIVHRDLKPANVLRAADGRWMLADFGLAQSADPRTRAPLRVASGGTLQFMAPEQLEDHPERLGPWTDLYALGCLVWTLACGQPPFHAYAGFAVVNAHRGADPPPFAPRRTVPPGLADWLRSLLRTEPSERPTCAADALDSFDAALGKAGPKTLARPDEERAASPLAGVGLGLSGVRDLPLRGRRAERDALWSIAQDVAAGARRLVVLRGVSGVGKSRLARWLGEGLEERGVGRVLKVVHGPQGGADDGLEAMLRRMLGLPNGDPQALASRLEARFGPLKAGLFADALARRQATDGPSHAGGPDRSVLSQLLLLAAGSKTPVLWVDDAQWGPESLRFAVDALAGGTGGFLGILTVQEESLAESPVAQRELQRAGDAGAVEIPLGPFVGAEREEFLRSLLVLDSALLGELDRLSSGNPLLAERLVRDQVARGVLQPGPRGFEVASGTSLALPKDLNSVWTHFVDRVVAGNPAWREPLEKAATLGVTVDLEEWEAICGAPIDPDLLEAAVRARLASVDGHAWVFSHGMIRQSLVESADAAGRLQSHHARAAAVLANRQAGPERLGRHLLAADQPLAALPHLLDGAGQAVSGQRLPTVAALHRLLEPVMELANSGQEEAWWIQRMWLEWRLDRGNYRGEVLDQCLELADERGWEDLGVQAWRLRAISSSHVGDLDTAAAAVEEAERRARPGSFAGKQITHARSLVLLNQGRVREALAVVEPLIPWFDAIEDAHHAGQAHLQAARAHQRLGDFDATEERLAGAKTWFERVGFQLGLCMASSMQGEIARGRGALDDAVVHYRQALAGYQLLGRESFVFTEHLNLCLVAGLQDRWPDATRHVDAAADRHRSEDEVGSSLALRLLQAACTADRADDEADLHLQAARLMLRRTGLVDGDLAFAAELVGRRAGACGFHERAAAAESIASDQRRLLDERSSTR